MNQKLVELAVRRVQAGEVTERGLAKASGFSQPHLHNVLKGIRSLSNEKADRLMDVLRVGVGDLLWSGVGDGSAEIRVVPLMRHRIGPGNDASLTLFRGAVPFRGSQVDGLVDPVGARLAADPGMPAVLAANDLVLLDQNPVHRSAATADGMWVTAGPEGLRVRHLTMNGTAVHLGTRGSLDHPEDWRPPTGYYRSILEVARARIVWIGREVETEAPGSSQPAGCGD